MMCWPASPVCETIWIILLQTAAVKLHDQPHQVFRAGPQARIAGLLQPFNQYFDSLKPLLEYLVFEHQCFLSQPND